MSFDDARHDVLDHARRMWQAGLVVASAGNVSRRIGDDGRLIAITPASIPYETMTADEIVVVELASGLAVDSSGLAAASIRPPSSELPMHLGVYRARADVQAIVHTHAPYVTTLSVLHKSLPPIIDEMLLYFGGTIEVTDYAFTGTEEVGTNVVRALGERPGVLLANHGNVCIGRDLREALHVAITMESTARVYVQALQIGEPVLLPESAIEQGRRRYQGGGAPGPLAPSTDGERGRVSRSEAKPNEG